MIDVVDCFVKRVFCLNTETICTHGWSLLCMHFALRVSAMYVFSSIKGEMLGIVVLPPSCNGMLQRHGRKCAGVTSRQSVKYSTNRTYTAVSCLFIVTHTNTTASRATVIFKKGKNVLIHRDGTKFHIHVHYRLYYLHLAHSK